MRSFSFPLLVAAGALAAATALPGAALARSDGGGGNFGDTFVNDAQKNPRFIEPYADQDPARYRVGAPREGYFDRKAAWGEYGPPERRFNPARPGW